MDITERKHVEDGIREQEAELRQILDAAPQHLSVLRGDGSHLYINQSSPDFLGLTLEEWQNRDIRELVHPDDAERVAGERKRALSSGSPRASPGNHNVGGTLATSAIAGDTEALGQLFLGRSGPKQVGMEPTDS